MKKAALLLVALLLSASMAQQTIRVSVVNGHPAVFIWVQQLTNTFIPAVDAALEGSGYKIDWSEFYGGTLAPVGGELEALEAGLAEVGIVPTLFESSALPLQNITYVAPFGSPDAAVVADIINNMHETIPAMIDSWERYNLEYLGSGFTLDNYTLMTKFPVNTLADLRGKRIGAPGAAVNWLDGTGAVAVSGDLTTYYNDIQTGLYDGVVTFPTAAAPARLQEVAPYITLMDFGAMYAGSVVARKDWYDSQPAAVQQALREGAKAFGAGFAEAITARLQSSLDQMAADGGTVTPAPAGLREAWAAAMPNQPKAWAAGLDAQGLPGTEVLHTYLQGLRDAGVVLPRNWDQE
jgi:TRAP-type C4-dicarboxylate transport system substrate-binding protein